jgi:hypothetical protein
MPTCIISVKVLKPGDRADALLDVVSDALHITPSRERSPEVADFWFTNMESDEAWDATDKAIANAGEDADEYLLLWPKQQG